MQLKVKKIAADEVSALTKLFEYDDPQAELDKVARQIAYGIVDVFVLVNEQEPIGELRVQYDCGNNLETIDWKRVYLFAFRVNAKYRNRGCGSYLIEYVIQECACRGYSEYTVGVEVENTCAKHIYAKLGFNTKLAHKTDNWGGESYEYDLFLKSDDVLKG